MSEKTQSRLELLGAGLAVAGVALIYIPAALILAGLVLIAIGNLPKRGG
ncbi:hypothetical protein [Nesterenkonia sp. PF2B19]|nr:hypothetical protein [Nesterenkonia sp. PF2B19]